jgi:hypothetical protein
MVKVNLLNRWQRPYRDKVVFMLDDQNTFVAYLHEAVEELILVSGGILVLYSSDQSPIELHSAYEDSMLDIPCELYIGLRNALKGNLEYPYLKRERNLGYLSNLICARDPRASNNKAEHFWKYKIWSACYGPETWLHTQNGTIFKDIFIN